MCVCVEEKPHIGNTQPIQISKTQDEKKQQKTSPNSLATTIE